MHHLRFHRRGPSNSSSPVSDQLSPFSHPEHPQSIHDIASRPEHLPRFSTAANTPPVHPSHSERAPIQKPSEQAFADATAPLGRPTADAADSGFMGGLALEKYRRAFETSREDDSGAPDQDSSDATNSRAKPLPPPINTNLPPTRPPPVPIKQVRHTTSFVSPTQLQNNDGATGKRPAGTRLATEPVGAAGSPSPQEGQKGKKGLPFLKNSMSGLLLRRKASQNAPDLRPLPLPQTNEKTYDPRIRGTRVHDFSAPRQRVVPTRKPTVPGAEVWTGWDKYHQAAVQTSHSTDLPLRMQSGGSNGTAPGSTTSGASESGSQKTAGLSKESSTKSAHGLKRMSLEDKPLPADPPISELSIKEGVEGAHSISVKSRPMSVASSMNRTNPSTRTAKSRHFSVSGTSIKELSGLPRHMKSTSSRFSFDIKGADMEEKLLEERHRQKELERKANNPVSSNRDSRFDEFDEDTFDYDAAMDYDGLEEMIPGVNADYEDDYFEEETPFEEEVPLVGDDDDDDIDVANDPDNDQENFAGFVFSRSNPQSSLVSPATPGTLATPRDATGRPIGHAITKDRTPDILSAISPIVTEVQIPGKQDEDLPLSGLGIQGLEGPPKTQYDPTVFQERRNLLIHDNDDSKDAPDKGLYFDEGLMEELQMEADEIQKSTFDESIFDNDDTDQYGRPIPGAFAQAQEAMKAEQEKMRRESDMTSNSGLSESTAYTSVSTGLQTIPSVTEKAAEIEPVKLGSPPHTSPSQLTSEDKVAAYQKALADAAHKAATSGWKSRWDDAPESPETETAGDPDVTVTSPTTGSQPSSGGHKPDPAFNDYDDDGFEDGFEAGMDDYDFDDDFIAEANASALAYDADGFYGQEFGFYSAPVAQGSHGASNSNGSQGNETQYGGYFGPSGVNRSVSGRVLREPNLTPITERSEYSNRNSIMSLALPSAALDGRHSMQSPGLHQLALALGNDDDYSYASLARLRHKPWADSQISLSSSKDGSPRSERPPQIERFESSSPAPWETGRQPPSHLSGVGGGPHARKNSSYSLLSNSDTASATGSPTITTSAMPLPSTAIPCQSPFSPPPPVPHFAPPPPPPASQSPQCPPVLEDDEAEDFSNLQNRNKASLSALGFTEVDDTSSDKAFEGLDMAQLHSPPAVPAPLNSPPPIPTRI